MKIIVTGGGTAGHIYPALATVEELKRKEPKASFLYIGTKNENEKKMVEQAGIPFRGIYTGKFRRYWREDIKAALQNFTDIFRLIIGFFQSLWIILRFKPDVIFAKGGYVTLPPILAGWCMKVPCLIHESDAQIGLANRISLRFCKKIAISFPPQLFPKLPVSKVIFTGNPIRAEILKGDIYKAQEFFKTSPDLPVILVTGGSQGAHKINQTIALSLDNLLKKCQIIHLTGSRDFKWLNRIRAGLPSQFQKRYIVCSFLTGRLKDALALACLVVSRAGANILAELSCLGKPLVLIPLSGHQSKNAQYFASRKAAYIIKNDQLNRKILENTILDLLGSPEELSTLSKNIKDLAEPEAASALAEEILNLA